MVSEFAEQFSRCCIVGSRGLYSSIEVTEMAALSDLSGIGLKLIPLRVEPDTFEATLARLGPGVCNILRVVASAQVLFAVIESVVVLMIDFLFATQNLLMHQHVSVVTDTDTPCGIKDKATIPSMIFYRVPIELIQSFVVFGIHDGILALRQRNEPDRWIRRLDDVVPTNMVFPHRRILSEVRYGIR